MLYKVELKVDVPKRHPFSFVELHKLPCNCADENASDIIEQYLVV